MSARDEQSNGLAYVADTDDADVDGEENVLCDGWRRVFHQTILILWRKGDREFFVRIIYVSTQVKNIVAFY